MRVGAVLTEWAGSGIVPEPPRISVVGNVMRHGTNTPGALTLVGSNSSGAAYLEDNIATNVAGSPVPIASSTVTLLATKPMSSAASGLSWPTGLVALPASETVASVVAHAGARPEGSRRGRYPHRRRLPGRHGSVREQPRGSWRLPHGRTDGARVGGARHRHRRVAGGILRGRGVNPNATPNRLGLAHGDKVRQCALETDLRSCVATRRRPAWEWEAGRQ